MPLSNDTLYSGFYLPGVSTDLSKIKGTKLPVASFHPGRTDRNGGHRDRFNMSGLGPYHFHHGMPAHLHPNGVCHMNQTLAGIFQAIGIVNPFSAIGNWMLAAIERHVTRAANLSGPDWNLLLQIMERLVQHAIDVGETALIRVRSMLVSLIDTLVNMHTTALGTVIARMLQLLHLVEESLAFLVGMSGADEHFHFNATFDNEIMSNGFITGQGRPPQSGLQVGLRGNGQLHGCGPFAVYNALFYLRGGLNAATSEERAAIAESPAAIIRFLEISGGLNLHGQFGTNPEPLADYIRKSGFSALINYLPSSLDSQIRGSAASILLYAGSLNYVHYVMIHYVEETSSFFLYNVETFDTEPDSSASVDSWLIDGNMTYRPIALINILR